MNRKTSYTIQIPNMDSAEQQVYISKGGIRQTIESLVACTSSPQSRHSLQVFSVEQVLIGINNENPESYIGINTERSERQKSKPQPTLTLLIPQLKRVLSSCLLPPYSLLYIQTYHFLFVCTDLQTSMINQWLALPSDFQASYISCVQTRYHHTYITCSYSPLYQKFRIFSQQSYLCLSSSNKADQNFTKFKTFN